jgi:hypothetical protein
MRTASTALRLITASFYLWLTSCSTSRYSGSGSMDAHELSRSVLVIREGRGAEVSHSWEPMSSVDLSQYPSRAIDSRKEGRIVRVTWTRNCEDERDACVEMCMKSLTGPDWSHASKGSKFKICEGRCRPAYLDCCRLREQAEARNFPVVDDAVDWLKQHRKEVLVGTAVVIAGVTFVVIVVGTGGAALLLAPAVLLVSPDGSSELPSLAMKP